METIKSELLRLNLDDLAKGAVVAALAALLSMTQQGLTAHGFDLASYDWKLILDLSLQAGVAYILKNFLSDSQGKVLGKIG